MGYDLDLSCRERSGRGPSEVIGGVLISEYVQAGSLRRLGAAGLGIRCTATVVGASAIRCCPRRVRGGGAKANRPGETGKQGTPGESPALMLPDNYAYIAIRPTQEPAQPQFMAPSCFIPSRRIRRLSQSLHSSTIDTTAPANARPLDRMNDRALSACHDEGGRLGKRAGTRGGFHPQLAVSVARPAWQRGARGSEKTGSLRPDAIPPTGARVVGRRTGKRDRRGRND